MCVFDLQKSTLKYMPMFNFISFVLLFNFNTCFASLTLFLRYVMIFLKFVQAVIPTIEYDYTRNFNL